MTSSERHRLRRRAHGLDPVVMIGKDGLSSGVVAATDAALAAHELIKIRFQHFKEDRRAMTARLAAGTASEVVAVVGHVGILYREGDSPEAPPAADQWAHGPGKA